MNGKRAGRRSGRRVYEAPYSSFKDRTLDRIFEAFDAHPRLRSFKDLAVAAGLATSTVYVANRHGARLPQLRTIFLLARAVGLEVSLTEARAGRGEGPKLKVVR